MSASVQTSGSSKDPAKNQEEGRKAQLRNSVLQQLAALEKMSMPELKKKWRELNATEPPAGNRQYLLRRLAYRIQEILLGGLDEATRKRLEQIARNDPMSCIGASPKKKNPQDGLVSGTRLLRRWRGLQYEVRVVEGGFEYGGQVHRSLTAVAKVITGSKWNGKVFFGLTKARRKGGSDD
jgi:hypothetical protein